MAEASAHKLSYVAEVTRGTTPTNPRFRALPDTRTTLGLTRENLTSERLTGDRFPAEPRSGAKGVAGDIPADLSTRAYDDFIASALQGSWVESGTADTVTLEQAGVESTLVDVGDTFATSNGVVTVESLDSKAQQIVLRFDATVTAAATTHTINGLDSTTIDSEVFEVTAYQDGEENAIVKAGDTRLSFSILREFSDFSGGGPVLLFKGCEVSAWNLTAAANGIAKSTFTFFGRDMDAPAATAPANSSVAPAFDSQPFDTFSGSLEIDGVDSCIVTDYSVTINNGHAPRYVVGCAESEDASVTQSLIEGSITVYYGDAELYKKFVNEQSLALKLTLEDAAANKMVIDLPNLIVGNGTQPDVSADGPITMTVNFTAHKDDTLQSHMSVQRIYPI